MAFTEGNKIAANAARLNSPTVLANKGLYQVISDVPTQAYYDMLQRGELNKQTDTEIRKYLGVTAGVPLMFDPYDRVTLLNNEPYLPGYAMITAVSLGDGYAKRTEIVTTNIERPFSDEVTTHLGLRAQAAGWMRRQVLDIDKMSAEEIDDLGHNLAPVVDLSQRRQASSKVSDPLGQTG